MATQRAGVAVLMLALVLEAAVFAVLLHRIDISHHSVLLVSVSVPIFVAAVWLLARLDLPARATMWIVLSAGVAFQLIALTQQPLTSDDDYRYIWDGKVQLAGIDPYRYAPNAPQLAFLHDHLLFGTAGHCAHLIPGGCTAINRPSAPTVYPPVAQAVFTLMRITSFGGHGGRLPFQLLAATATTAVGWLLARGALRRDRPMWVVALWAWCPVTISEFGNNAHIDALAVLLTVLALTATANRRPGLCGLLVGAAIATKLYPAIVLPSLLRRRPAVVLSAAAALVAVSYVPHVLAVGSKVIGFLPGYLRQEGYGSGSRLLLLGAVIPRPFDVVAGVLLGAAVLVWTWRRCDADAPERTAVTVMGTAILIATPNYGWYCALLIALIVMSGAWQWLPVALAPTFTYLYRHDYAHSGVPSSTVYLIAALLSLAGFLLRRRGTPRSGHPEVSSGPEERCSAPG